MKERGKRMILRERVERDRVGTTTWGLPVLQVHLEILLNLLIYLKSHIYLKMSAFLLLTKNVGG